MIEEKKPLEKYISLQEAAKFCSYSQEYLSLRARQGKLKSAKLGRNWVTTKEWLSEYLRSNGNGYQVAIEVKESKPPENLPFAPDNFSPEIFQPPRNIFDAFKRLNLKPRPSFIFALVFTLIVAGGVFGKENFSGVYNDVSQIAKNISEKIVNEDFMISGNVVSVGEISKKSFGIFGGYGSWAQEKINKKINNNSTLNVFDNYGSWVKQKSGPIVSPIVKSYQAADKFSEKKFSLVFWKTVKTVNFIEKKTNQTVTAINEGYSSAVRAPKLFADFLARIPKLAMSPWRDFAELKSELKSELSALKETPFLVKRVEVERVVEPVKEITREVETIQQITKVDDAVLADLKTTLSYLEGEIGKRLYAPGGVISQTIRVTEPVQSPKIYQENGEIVLQTRGSGNVILSAATGLQMYGQQVVIESTNTLNPMIYLASKSRIGGGLTVDGSITGGALSASSIGASGNATVGGDLTVSGSITVSGSQNLSGIIDIAASSPNPILQVRQNGAGAVAKFLDSSGTAIFTIANDGSITVNATATAASFASGANDSTVRKSSEEVFREILPISRYDIPAQTGTTTYFRISKAFDQNPLSAVPSVLPGAARVYKLIIKYDDDIPANSSSSWRIYRPAAGATSDSFVLLGRNSSLISEGSPTTTQNLTIPNTDWQIDVKLSEADVGKSLRIFQIFLAAYDKIN